MPRTTLRLALTLALIAPLSPAVAQDEGKDEALRAEARAAWGETGSPEENRALVREALETVMMAKELGRAGEFYGDPYLQNNPRIPDGVEAMTGYFAEIFAAFPDYTPTIDLIVGEDDLVSVFLTWRGTHTGEAFEGVEATGAEVVTKTADVFRVRDGRIVEHWDVVDRTGLLTPLGLMTVTDQGDGEG